MDVEHPVSRSLEADWNDVAAAVDIALSESELAAVAINDDRASARWYEQESGRRVTYTLLGVNGETGQLAVTRGDDRPTTTIELSATFDPRIARTRAEGFVRDIAARLEKLKGDRASMIGGAFGIPAK